MKKMTIIEKANAYDEALKVGKNYYKQGNEETKRMLLTCFPVLGKSKDEAIREDLLDYFKNFPDILWNGNYVKDIISWLEKQGGKDMMKTTIWKHWKDGIAGNGEGKQIYLIKSGDSHTLSSCLGYECDYIELSDLDKLMLSEKQGDKHSDEVKPKFKAGDTIRFKNSYAEYTIESVADGHYYGKGLSIPIADGDRYYELVERKIENKVETKFHEGEWITNGDYTWKIVEVKPLDYTLQSQDGNIIDDTISYVDEQFHSFTIKDAKDGDVLVTIDTVHPFIYKGCLDSNHPDSPVAYCGIDTEGDFYPSGGCWWTDEKIQPSTKEQRDILFAKMKDAGYTFDFEKKELKKIEQKPTWSEKDEKMLEIITSVLQVNFEPVERFSGYEEYMNVDLIHWLKSLKDRYTWKPSEEQLETFDYYLDADISNKDKKILFGLYNDLKQL